LTIERFNIHAHVENRGAEHDMELSRLSSLLAIVGAINIFYGMYGLIQIDLVKMLISTVTYLILMYSSAILDSKSGEMARERKIEQIGLQASELRKEVRAY
jgi:phosphatidylserine synthase